MLKLVLGDCECSHSQFGRRIFSHTFFCALSPLLMKKDDDLLFMEMGDWFPKWKGGRRVSRASTVFPFG